MIIAAALASGGCTRQHSFEGFKAAAHQAHSSGVPGPGGDSQAPAPVPAPAPAPAPTASPVPTPSSSPSP
ncbi:MAG TPA: hypothetical protein VM598_00745, partial [Bdellovibrionota bacterium]|nr:hypothetical protein [Bdellovibrionota bacterium]